MKQLNKKLSKSMLIAACAVCLPFLSAKAQFIGSTMVPADKRFSSSAGYDNLKNPTDSTVYQWSQKGFPIPVAMYGWDDKGVKSLVGTGKLVNDTEDAISYEETQSGTVMVANVNFNAFGEALKMTMTAKGATAPFLEMNFQYWRKANNQLDSVLVTTNITGLGSSWSKIKYKTYDTSGRPTLVESMNGQGVYQKEVYTYSATQQVVETSENSAATGFVLLPTEKNVASLDAKGRTTREDKYTYDAYNTAWNLDSYTIYHYDSQAGIQIVDAEAQVIVNLTGGNLLVNSQAAETVEIYSVSGELLHATQKVAGESNIPVANLPAGVYIIKGGSGWAKKVVKQ